MDTTSHFPSSKLQDGQMANMPNAGKLIEAIRYVGYGNFAAISDIIDNSFDAYAKNIWITFMPHGTDFKLILADDGFGMSKSTLDEALKLGSETQRSAQSDLGKFGMGLVTASLSIAKNLTVISREKDGQYYYSEQDVDSIKETNQFTKILREATTEEIGEFKTYTNNAASGTVVILTKCDNFQDKNLDQFSNKLIKEVGQTFRLFLQTRSIFVRGKKILPIDPLMYDDKKTEILDEVQFDIEEEKKIQQVRIKFVMLPDYLDSKQMGINQACQGFYVMRNNREIASGVTLDVFTKHNRYNRFRAEIHFSGLLDKSMGISFTKREIRPKQALLDKIKEFTVHQIKTIERKALRDNVRDKDEEMQHAQSAKIISEKSKLLILPDVKIEKRKPGVKTGTNEPKDTGGERKPTLTQLVHKDSLNCDFQVRPMGTAGVLFEYDAIGRKIVITYNQDHPFYQKMFIENDSNSDLKASIDYMVYSLATAGLSVFDEGKIALIENYIAIFSTNLKTLLR